MSNNGHFKKGNQLWKLVEYPGKPKKYTPEALWQKFQDYMEYNTGVSWPKDDFIKSGPSSGTIIEMQVQNPPSIMAFCTFAGISEDTFRNYLNCKTGENAAEYVAVVSAIRAIIQEIQIAGAATNVFNSNIIARWAGLVDKKEVEISATMSDDERKDAINKILDQIKKT
jgi:hypothetical protein